MSPSCHMRYVLGVRFEKIWVEQCRATRAIKRRFGAKSALDYLIGEKLLAFADAAREHPSFAKELPRFLAGIWQVFNEYEIASYVASRRPLARKLLRQLLICVDRAGERLLQIGQLRPRQPKPDGAGGTWLTLDQSARVERLDHLMDDRRRDAKEALQIRFGRRPPVDLRVVVDVREILPLLRRERLRCLGDRLGPALFFRERLLDACQPVVHGIEHTSHTRFRAVVCFGRHMAGKIVDVI